MILHERTYLLCGEVVSTNLLFAKIINSKYMPHIAIEKIIAKSIGGSKISEIGNKIEMMTPTIRKKRYFMPENNLGMNKSKARLAMELMEMTIPIRNGLLTCDSTYIGTAYDIIPSAIFIRKFVEEKIRTEVRYGGIFLTLCKLTFMKQFIVHTFGQLTQNIYYAQNTQIMS
jgi:hypothetical protein